jgi:hypothetical protein
MLPTSRRVRAYFAPVTRGAETPTIFDPAAQSLFALDSPPAPWLDLGWIENFQRTATTTVVPITAGAKSAAAALARKDLSARVEFDFREWGKLQMALAGGSQHMNVLATSSAATAAGSGGYEPIPAVPVLSGSTATQLILAPVNLLGFNVGDLVAADIDYTGQIGYVGSAIAGAYVKNASDVRNDVHYIRRVTFNVARVGSKSPTSLNLAQPLPGGAPPADCAVQKIVGFVDREGGSFFQEWSAIFVIPEESGARIIFHYPRLQSASAAGETAFEIAAPIQAHALHAAFLALPVTDLNDNEQVLCYRSFFPASNSAVY